MENHPRKAGFVPTPGKSIKPATLTDASVRISRLETSSSQPRTALAEDFEAHFRSENSAKKSTKSEVHGEEIEDGFGVTEFVAQDSGLLRKKEKWSVGARVTAAAVGILGSIAAGLYSIRPRDPAFNVDLITLKGFNLRFCTDSPLLLAVVDVSLILHINVTNPNVAPIVFSSTIMDIYYRSSLLGQAIVQSGDQAARSSKVMEVPAKLDGLELTNHLKDLMYDVAKREMTLHSVVTISGDSLVWKWKHHFEVHVDSDIKVDPIFMDVLEQENRVHLEMASIC